MDKIQKNCMLGLIQSRCDGESHHSIVGVFSNGATLQHCINPGGCEYSMICEGFSEAKNAPTSECEERRLIISYTRIHEIGFWSFTPWHKDIERASKGFFAALGTDDIQTAQSFIAMAKYEMGMIYIKDNG